MSSSIIEQSQKCTKCGEEYPATLEYWHRDNARKDGLRCYCKFCVREAHQHWYKTNFEKVRNKARHWYKTNSERARENGRRWRKANPEKIREKVKHYQKIHPDRIREKNKRWYKANLKKARENGRRRYKANSEKALVKNHKRRARKQQAGGSFSNKDIQLMMINQRGRCWYCQCDIRDGYHIDHRIPLSRGGTNDPSNLVLACASCNLSKHNKLPHEWNDRLL